MMKIPRIHVMVFILLILASCVGCGSERGCYCPGTRTITIDTRPVNMTSANPVNQSVNSNTWQNTNNFQNSSGISSRNMIERRDRE